MEHSLYTKATYNQPRGQLVLCPRNCQVVLRAKPQTNKIRFICPVCDSRATVDIPSVDHLTPLGKAGLIKTSFPQTPYPVQEWTCNGPRVPQTLPGSQVATLQVPMQGVNAVQPSDFGMVPAPDSITRSASLPSGPTLASSSSSLRIRIPSKKRSQSTSRTFKPAPSSDDPNQRPSSSSSSSKTTKKRQKTE